MIRRIANNFNFKNLFDYFEHKSFLFFLFPERVEDIFILFFLIFPIFKKEDRTRSKYDTCDRSAEDTGIKQHTNSPPRLKRNQIPKMLSIGFLHNQAKNPEEPEIPYCCSKWSVDILATLAHGRSKSLQASPYNCNPRPCPQTLH